jgi:lysozyme family protein
MFEKFLNEILINEGTYVNDPTDKGGETYFGIARKIHPHWNGWIIIDEIKENNENWLEILKNKQIPNEKLKQELINFYKENFWNKIKGDELNKISEKVAFYIFDTSVNMGWKTAAKFLQEAINNIYKKYNKNKKIVVDGLIGNKTLSAFKEVKKLIECDYEFLLEVIKERSIKYAKIVAHNPSQSKFIHGWIRRAFKI